MHFHCRGDKFKLDNGVRPRAVADDLLYNAGKTYAMPLLLYKIELGSSIHEDHVDSFHKNSRIGLDHFWTNQATDLPIDHFFQYDTHELG